MKKSSKPFDDRVDAGRQLAERLAPRDDEVVVLGLPRGGVPVAREVAVALGAPLDVFVVRKLGVPGHEELAMGAIASGGTIIVDRGLVERLGLRAHDIEEVARREFLELHRRESAYRRHEPPPSVTDRTVILVDDGLATGSTMRAAIAALRARHPARIIAAVPVGAPDTCRSLAEEADEVVCLRIPSPFVAVGHHYEDFRPTTDEEVRQALAVRPPPLRRAPADDLPRRLSLSGPGAYDELLEAVGSRRLVLLGEASHGTHEFYVERARITRRLIEEQGFTAVAVEADWPDAHRVNRFVRGGGEDPDPDTALGDFVRFPRWMWRNTVVRDFIGWLRQRNGGVPLEHRCGFYGLDLYSLQSSMAAVLDYLESVDPAAAARARHRYSCFQHIGAEGQVYGAAVAYGRAESCEDEAVDQLVELRRKASEMAAADGRAAEDEAFHAAQNARLVANAEGYYRAMFGGRARSWNLRDRHMADTLDALAAHLGGDAGAPAKVVVWAHNSHVGDARATEMSERGELNLGQLVRERHGDDALLVGFTTAGGTVTAASDWDGPAERKRVRPPLPGSVEQTLHETGEASFLMTALNTADAGPLTRPLLERAIGVIYRPETERMSHYFRAQASRQFDALIHIDDTRALEPLEPDPGWPAGPEPPETYPTAL